MSDYYREKLAADRLKEVYDLAPPRVRQYLNAELQHVLQVIRKGDSVLELGCGYGRVLEPLAGVAGFVVGIDTSVASLETARALSGRLSNVRVAAMDASALAFADCSFDIVACIQNGISAFHRDQRQLVAEAFRVVRKGGIVLFSSYSTRFWDDRLDWFRIQSRAGLLGEIDESKTGDGIIVCNDGFTATTVDEAQFGRLTGGFDAEVSIIEVDGSSLFCQMTRRS